MAISLKGRSEREALIALGLPLDEIAALEGCTRQAIWIYIQKSGQQEFYKERRAVVQQEIGRHGLKEGISTPSLFQRQVLRMLENYITKRCHEAGFAPEKAWEYLQSCKKHKPKRTFEELVKFFDGYNYARQREVKLSLAELGEYFDWESPAYTGYVLSKVGLAPLYGKSGRLSSEQFLKKKKRVLRCFSLPLSIADLSYFSGVLEGSVKKYFLNEGPRQGVKAGGIQRFTSVFGKGHEAILTYHRASRIYEADDAGLTLEETCEYVPTKPVAVKYAKEHRKEIEPVIITALQKLYPGEEYKVPYRNKYEIV